MALLHTIPITLGTCLLQKMNCQKYFKTGHPGAESQYQNHYRCGLKVFCTFYHPDLQLESSLILSTLHYLTEEPKDKLLKDTLGSEDAKVLNHPPLF
jgi:hypothetical protein